MPPPKVSVIVPTYQRAPTLQKTLTALCAVDYPDDLLEIVVVDDGSTDWTPASVVKFSKARYAYQPNSGVAVARNHGARLSTGDILIFVDDDIIVAADNVWRHLAVRELYGECVVAGRSEFDPSLRAELLRSPFGRFRLWSEDLVQDDQAERWGTQGRIEVASVDTQNMSISRRFFWGIGGFDESFPVGAEDQDLCWRARSAGAVIVRDHGIRVLHNDRHVDLRSLCHREERGAIGLVYLARKHPDFPVPSSLDLNGPLRRTDSPRLAVRKISRSAMAHPGALAVAHWIVRVVQRVRPRGGWPLDYLYRATTGLYVFRGIRRGLQLTATDRWASAHDARDV
jgi:glycosyltransferase involved in cell wall biosynthesis